MGGGARTRSLVRLARRARLAGAALLVSACGYHAIYGGETERLHVVLLRSLIPDAVATDEVLSGVRETLAREGALAAGEGYPRVEVEVLREDEASEGVVASEIPGVSGGAVRARGTEVGLVARACLVRAPRGPCERDTGDVRALDLASSELGGGAGPSAVTDAFHHRDTARATGKRLGERLAMHVLGGPTASDEGVGRER